MQLPIEGPVTLAKRVVHPREPEPGREPQPGAVTDPEQALRLAGHLEHGAR